MSRLTTPLLVVTLAASLVGSGLIWSIRSSVVRVAKSPQIHRQENGVMEQTYAHTIVSGTTQGEPPNIPVAIHVYTYKTEEETYSEFTSRHRAECIAVGATLSNPVYTAGS